jgi:hypothetical protein
MLVIARFNWPFYLAAAVVLVAAGAAAVTVSNTWGRGACLAAALGAGYFLVGSLGVSHLVYDRSDLYRLGWLERALHGAKRGRMACCHAGYDDISAALRERSGAGEWLVLDHYDELRMTEASIRRARRIYPPVAGTRAAGHAAWPLDDGSLDVVFGILAIHELRSEDERAEWFGEARRCLAAGGRVVLAEHTRDLANFLAFGPGFVHFHSAAGWRRSWERGGFSLVDDFKLTPWVRVFILKA